MKYSYNWLKELSGTRKSAQKLAELLTVHAFEVESIDKVGGFKDVVVGEVLEMHKHPDADRLNVALINVGEKHNLQIVCGAPNLRKGQKVPVALVGAILPGDFEIKKTDIRGVTSNGMICAEDELGLGDDHDGIMVLHAKAKIGTDFAKFMKASDTIIDIDVLPNRGHDALAHTAMAREITALEGRSAKTFYDTEPKLPRTKIADFNVKISSKNCTRYSAIKIDGVRVAPSPQWLQARLRVLGMQPINNIVDVTNYVLRELGQPLHAFDATQMSAVDVRQAKEGEQLELLDDTVLTLTKDDLVITDGKKPTALAGVMGGKHSGICEQTTAVILEAAHFDAASVRYSRVRHNLNTDASYHFERDLDPHLVAYGAIRAAELIAEIGHGDIVGAENVYHGTASKSVRTKIIVTGAHIERLLGISVPTAHVKKILKNLGCVVKSAKRQKKKGKGACAVFTVTPPTVRRDLMMAEDIIEEIGRVYGYDHITPVAPRAAVQSAPVNEQRVFERNLKNLFVRAGLTEVKRYSFYDAKSAHALGLPVTEHMALANPLSGEQALMRMSLIPGVISSAIGNMRYHSETAVFEIGRVYIPTELTDLPEERVQVCTVRIAQSDKNGEHFYELKGMVEHVLHSLGIVGVYYDSHEEDRARYWHETRSASIKDADGKVIGMIGELSAHSAKMLGAKKRRVAIATFDASILHDLAQRERAYTPLRKYPTVVRDLSMIVTEKMKVIDVQSVIAQAGGELVIDVDLFDLYMDTETSKKSFAFHIRFGADDHTLENTDVDREVSAIIAALEANPDIAIKQSK